MHRHWIAPDGATVITSIDWVPEKEEDKPFSVHDRFKQFVADNQHFSDLPVQIIEHMSSCPELTHENGVFRCHGNSWDTKIWKEIHEGKTE